MDLNLVPFVDFLSCLIAFLMMTAVLSNLHALPSDQTVSGGGSAEAPPMLTVHVSRLGVWVARGATGTRVPHGEAGPDWAAVEAQLVADRALHPGEDHMVLNVDDGVGYGDAAALLDLAARLDYAPPLLAGGPPAGP